MNRPGDTPAGLSHHGDGDLVPGLADLAVNIRSTGTPAWMAEAIARADLAAYPDQSAARAAVAARHRREPAEVLLTAGAAEAFVLLARVLRPRRAVVIHPQFTEPEAALRAAGHPVDRVVLPYPFVLDAALIPADADLVFLGNPTNPTSVCHRREVIQTLRRPGRLVVVDEAFMDCIPGEPDSLASAELDGLVVIRSLTKTWALAGLRAGYLLASAELVTALAQAQPLWPVSAPALAACIATASPAALAEAAAWSARLAAQRDHLLARLEALSTVSVVPEATASFVLLGTGVPDVRIRLQHKGFAVRRGETFPGLDAAWVRVAVRDTATSERFTTALAEVLAEAATGMPAGVPAAGAPARPASQVLASAPAPAGSPRLVRQRAGQRRRVLVLGGARSGKSAFAEQRAAQLAEGPAERPGAQPAEPSPAAGPVTYVATAPASPGDTDWAARVERHRQRRPADWTTLETGNLTTLLARAEPDAQAEPGAPVLLVDSITAWLSSTMDAAGCWAEPPVPGARQRLAAAVDALVRTWQQAGASAGGAVVAVSDEVGGGIVPASASGRQFRDALGELNQRLAAAADEVWLVTAGIPGRLV